MWMYLCFYFKSYIILFNCKILKKNKDDDYYILNKSLEREIIKKV